MKYSDLIPAPLDLEYIDKLAGAYNINWQDDLDIEIDALDDRTSITNHIIACLLYKIAKDNIDDEDDCIKITNSIYTNCLDSGYDIDEDDVETEQAKEFIRNF